MNAPLTHKLESFAEGTYAQPRPQGPHAEGPGDEVDICILSYAVQTKGDR